MKKPLDREFAKLSIRRTFFLSLRTQLALSVHRICLAASYFFLGARPGISKTEYLSASSAGQSSGLTIRSGLSHTLVSTCSSSLSDPSQTLCVDRTLLGVVARWFKRAVKLIPFREVVLTRNPQSRAFYSSEDCSGVSLVECLYKPLYVLTAIKLKISKHSLSLVLIQVVETV